MNTAEKLLRYTAAAAVALIVPAWQGRAAYASSLDPHGIGGAVQMSLLCLAVTGPLGLAIATRGFGHGFRRGLRLALGYACWSLMILMPPVFFSTVSDESSNLAGEMILGALLSTLAVIPLCLVGALFIDPSMLERQRRGKTRICVEPDGDELLVRVKVR